MLTPPAYYMQPQDSGDTIQRTIYYVDSELFIKQLGRYMATKRYTSNTSKLTLVGLGTN